MTTQNPERIVVKCGTNLLTESDESGERLHEETFRNIGSGLIKLIESGCEVALVTSAAITAGMIETETTTRPDKETQLDVLQYLASVGSNPLNRLWNESTPGTITGDLYLTNNNFSKIEADNLRNALEVYFGKKSLPIINENDAITHEEITFGDNDNLSLMVAKLVRAKKLLLATDIDGLLARPENPESIIKVIDENIFEDEEALFNYVVDNYNGNGSGGMKSKLTVAIQAAKEGIDAWIFNGREEDSIHRAMNGEIGTHFVARKSVKADFNQLSMF